MEATAVAAAEVQARLIVKTTVAEAALTATTVGTTNSIIVKPTIMNLNLNHNLTRQLQ